MHADGGIRYFPQQREAPSLIIQGARDPLPAEGAQAWADALPNSELLLLEGIGHFPYIETPDRFFKAVDEFFGKSQ